jgi:hypothetical protein
MHVVLFAAGEVLQSRTPTCLLDDAQVDLKGSRHPYTHLGIASREDLRDVGKFPETIHHLFG